MECAQARALASAEEMLRGKMCHVSLPATRQLDGAAVAAAGMAKQTSLMPGRLAVAPDGLDQAEPNGMRRPPGGMPVLIRALRPCGGSP
jgi:hypothetical protein